jgi:hypothetical protein
MMAMLTRRALAPTSARAVALVGCATPDSVRAIASRLLRPRHERCGAVGGHVLDLRAANLTIECNWTNDLPMTVSIPPWGSANVLIVQQRMCSIVSQLRD